MPQQDPLAVPQLEVPGGTVRAMVDGVATFNDIAIHGECSNCRLQFSSDQDGVDPIISEQFVVQSGRTLPCTSGSRGPT